MFTAAKINSGRQQRFMLITTSTSLRDTIADVLYRSFNFLIFNKACCSYFGQLSQYSDLLRTGRRGDRIPVRAKFSAPVQTVPREHTTFWTMGLGTLPRTQSGWGMALATHRHIESRLKKEYSHTSTPLLGFHDRVQGKLSNLPVLLRFYHPNFKAVNEVRYFVLFFNQLNRTVL